MKKLLVSGLVIGMLSIGCAAENSNALIQPQPGAPCGNAGVACYDNDVSGQLVFSHECCPQDFICGGGFPNIGCPATACCFSPMGVHPGQTKYDWEKIVPKQHISILETEHGTRG